MTTTVAIPTVEPWTSASAVADVLRAAGHQAFFVGGCVRDLLLGRPVKDVDVASAAHPEQVEAACAAAGLKTIAVGRSFGVIIVVARSGLNVEVATFRCDGQYVDGRRPQTVRYSSAREDVERRDFTINALLVDPQGGAVVDHVDGLPDLAARRLRAVGDAAARLREDRLRVLRGLRFAGQLGLAIEPATWDAITGTSLGGLSAERLMQEWEKGLSARPDAWLDLLARSGRLGDFCPPLAAATPDDLAPALRALGRIDPADPFPVRAMHVLAPAPRAAALAWLDAQPLPTATRRMIAWLLTWAGDAVGPERLATLPAASRWRTLRDGHPPELLRALRSGQPGHPRLPEVEEWIADVRCGPLWKPTLRAGDLLRLGASPGPALGRILAACEDAELDGRLRDRGDLLALAERLLADAPPEPPRRV